MNAKGNGNGDGKTRKRVDFGAFKAWWPVQPWLVKVTVGFAVASILIALVPPVSALALITGLLTIVLALVSSLLTKDKAQRKVRRRIAWAGLAAIVVCVIMVNATGQGQSTPNPNPAPASVTASPADTKDQDQEDKAKQEQEAADKAKKAAEEEATKKKQAEEAAARKAQEEKEARKSAAANVKEGETKATDALATLAIKGRAPKTGYSRDQFGPSWEDVDHNGCDTRNDILARDLTNITKDGSCKVLTGTLNDPYTAQTIQFQRGQDTSSAVQIDHVVALSDAWQKGAQQLSADQRQQFANDPYNLLAVDGSANQQKSDGDAATWLPSNKSYRCEYVARQVGVKAKYALWVTQAEHDAIAGILATCPDQTIPAGGGAKIEPAQQETQQTQPQEQQATEQPQQEQQQTEPAPQPEPEQPAQQEPQQQEQSQDVYYHNCAAARAAGAAPLYQGQPGYSTKLDKDGDGVACEK